MGTLKPLPPQSINHAARAQAGFLARGLAAEAHARASGRYRSAEEVIDSLRQTLNLVYDADTPIGHDLGQKPPKAP